MNQNETSINDYAQSVIEKINQENPFLKDSLLRIEQLEDGFAAASMTADEEILNIYGMVHGGALFALADTAAGVCALMDSRHVVTLNSSISFVHAAGPGKIMARARRVHAGRSTGVYQADLFSSDGKMLASASFTMFFYHDHSPKI